MALAPDSVVGPLRKIHIGTYGFRGDIQPYVALAIGLKRAGYEVTILSNLNHRQFVESFQIGFLPVQYDAEEANRKPEMMSAMQSGSVRKWVASCQKETDAFADKSAEQLLNAWVNSPPDLLICGTLFDWNTLFARFRLDIAVMVVYLQAILYDPERMAFGMPTLPGGLHKYLWEMLLGQGHNLVCKAMDPCMVKRGYEPVKDVWNAADVVKLLHSGPEHPVYIASNPCLVEAMFSKKTKIPDKLELVGNLVMGDGEKLDDAPAYFGDADLLDRLKAFIDAGSKPVYMGWGSLTCKSGGHMVELATRALRHCGARAVIFKGWAGLSLEALKGQTKDPTLVAYAEQNMFFTTGVSHEWLFPLVRCTVHHGGAGTTTAALRAGVPTVITPCFLDQYDHAHLVQKLGVGVGMKQMQQLRYDGLAAAIQKACTDGDMQQRAAALGEKLRADDGVQKCVTAVGKYWEDWIVSGKLRAITQRVKAEAEDRKENGGCFCCGRGRGATG